MRWKGERVLGAAFGECPEPDGPNDAPFIVRGLGQVPEAMLGWPPHSADTVRHTMLPHLVEVLGRACEGTVGKPAQLYGRR